MVKFPIELCFILIFNNLFKVVFCEEKYLYCPFKEPLRGISQVPDFNSTFVKKGIDVKIPCCQKHSTGAIKNWFKRDRFMRDEIIELSNMVWRISQDNYELTIEKFSENDSGVYYCTEVVNVNRSTNFYYLIDVVVDSTIIFGGPKDDKGYIEKHLKPIEKYLDDYQNNAELHEFYEETRITLSVNLRFDDWSPCDACKKEKKRIGHCHLEPRTPTPCKHQCEIYKHALSVDCRATWSFNKIFPQLAQKIEQVPDFGRIIKCIGYCPGVEIPGIIAHKKFRLQYVPVGGTLQLSCPDYSIRKNCHWVRDGSKLSSNVYDTDDVVSVNEFAILFIKGASVKESGNYTCFLDEKFVTEFKIIIHEEFSEKNALWGRHVKYLSYIILLCSIVLVAGVTIGIIERNSFQQIDVKEALERFLRRKFDHEILEPPSA